MTIIVTVHDCRKLGYCMKSVRPWFESHGLDFRDFVKNGIDAETLMKTNDELAFRAIDEAKRRLADGR